MNGKLELWHLFFLGAAAQGLFLFLVLMVRQSPDHKNNILGVLILLYSLSLIDNVWFWSGYYLPYPHLLGISMAFPFIYGPLFYAYCREAMRAGTMGVRSEWKHYALPFIVLCYLTHYYGASAAGKLQLLETWFQNPVNSLVLPLAGLASLVVYGLMIYRFLKGNIDLLESGKRMNANWLYRMFLCYAVFVGLFVVYELLQFTRMSSVTSDYLIATGSAFFIYFIGYLGFSRSKLLNGIKVQEQKYQSSTITATAGEQILQKVKTHLEQTKAFTDNELRLGTLALELGITTHQLSQVINEHASTSFPDFVNSYRIAEAKKRLFDNDVRMNQLAIDVGFNNKTTFNLAFKKFVGCSPTEFRKRKNKPAG